METNDTLSNQSYAQDVIQEINDEIITVDVRRNYSSQKELILQDFMDVEYIALETNDDFLNQGRVMDIGKEIIAVKNQVDDGNIYIYDRHGKALRKINHKGQGPGEYTSISTITLDEDNEEIFVNDTNMRKIYVYDFYGNFKRSFNHQEGFGSSNIGNIAIKEYSFYSEIFNYDKNKLICYDRINNRIAFILISKHDGGIIKEIIIPFKDKKSLEQSRLDGENIYSIGPRPYHSIIPYNGNWILSEISSDTVYTFLTGYSLRPFIVRTPSIQSMNPEVMLILRFLSERYIVMETIRNEYNFDTQTGFLRTWLIYDKQNKTFFEYTIYNSDYSSKKEIFIAEFTPVNQEIATWYPLQAYQLVEDYENGRLKDGRLKEIAAKLDVEDNPVIMLIKHKNRG